MSAFVLGLEQARAAGPLDSGFASATQTLDRCQLPRAHRTGHAKPERDVSNCCAARRLCGVIPWMNDDVTVVITCFNYGAFLGECVESALAQLGGQPRVIVVDDGSTDRRTVAELARLPPHVEVVRQANAGVAAARNAGLRLVETPYALALDADDRLALDALQRLRGRLDADPGSASATGPCASSGHGRVS